jgi:hypothetical protein
MYASRHGDEGTEDNVRFLIERGADVNLLDNYETTALMFALMFACDDYEANENSVRFLIEAGANVNLQNKQGTTALMDASKYGHENIVRLLIAAGADVDVKNNQGVNALVNASVNGHKNVVILLIEAGANISTENLINFKGRSKIEKMWKKEQNKYLKKIAIDAYMRTRTNEYTTPTAESPLSGFHHRVDDDIYIMELIINMRYGDDDGYKRKKSGARKSPIKGNKQYQVAVEYYAPPNFKKSKYGTLSMNLESVMDEDENGNTIYFHLARVKAVNISNLLKYLNGIGNLKRILEIDEL